MDGLEKELLDESLIDASEESAYDWWDGDRHHVVLGTKGSIASVANAMTERERLTEEVERLRKICASVYDQLEESCGRCHGILETLRIAAGRGEGGE